MVKRRFGSVLILLLILLVVTVYGETYSMNVSGVPNLPLSVNPTGLNNRKALENTFADFSKAASPENRLYLFMMDPDGFKGINDKNGHPAGDQALMVTAILLLHSAQNIRTIVARYGGGSCSVQSNSTADGWIYSISNNIHLINAAGEDIDAGVPVVAELVTQADDGTRNYSAFYDFGRIREYIR